MAHSNFHYRDFDGEWQNTKDRQYSIVCAVYSCFSMTLFSLFFLFGSILQQASRAVCLLEGGGPNEGVTAHPAQPRCGRAFYSRW